MFEDLITKYQTARSAWEAKFDEDDSDENCGEEWTVYSDAGWAIIEYRCANLDEISQKASFISSDENLVDTLAHCQSDHAVKSLLASMIAPVEKSNNGGN
ncbi:hypothetical protein [Agrobacterium cavarae]|uniref:hypothetical protein n=1 Tax=Agrobacterium cavarae TaxID=2528239 RepID=UPI003FD69B77